MKIASYGTPLAFTASTVKTPIPIGKLQTITAPKGSTYEIKLSTSQLTPDKASEAIEKLRTEMKEKFGIDLIYAEAAENSINLIIQGSPFAWAALLALLPTILLLAGITLIGVSVWQITTAIPTWVWFLAITGTALLLFGPAIGNLILETIEKARMTAR
jgi:hypothetical protein